MNWRDLLLDGMLILTIATVIGAGVAIVYFLVDYVMKGIDEGRDK